MICAENNRRTPFNAYNRKHKTQFAWQNHIDIDITLINKVKSHNRLPGDTVFSRIGTNWVIFVETFFFLYICIFNLLSNRFRKLHATIFRYFFSPGVQNKNNEIYLFTFVSNPFEMLLFFVQFAREIDKIKHYTGYECKKKILHMDSRFEQERKWVMFVSIEIVEAIAFKWICMNVKVSLSLYFARLIFGISTHLSKKTFKWMRSIARSVQIVNVWKCMIFLFISNHLYNFSDKKSI